MTAINIGWAALRWLYALFFVATGLAILLYLVLGVGGPPPQVTAEAAAFDAALHRAGFIDPLLAASYLVGGAALAWPRTAPLGLILLAPSVVVIALFDILLAKAAVLGVVVALVWGLLALRHLSGFTGLWRYDAGRGQAPTGDPKPAS